MPGSESAKNNDPARDIDMLLFKRRRFRVARACYPCRRRKVKCDLNQPCNSCRSRGHPDLCDYTTWVAASAEIPGACENTFSREHPPKSFNEDSATSNIAGGLYVDPISPYGSKVHLGFESLPNLLSTYQGLNLWEPQLDLGLPSSFSSPNPQTFFELLCLQDSSTSFPFTTLWGPEDSPERVYSALPEDEVIWSYIWFCQGSLFRILPSTVHFPQFEAILSHFLDARAKSPADALSNPPPNCTPSWFALLFSILACGVQLSSSEADSDMMKSRVFACCSFQCLRMSNFISFPNIEDVQALIMLVNFLRNQADAGASWSMLGLTIRLAQALGLHCSPKPDTVTEPKGKDEALVKYFIWRSLIWQDTLVSLCYDRPSAITVLENIPVTTSSLSAENRLYSFSDSCHYLFVTANKISQALNCAKFSRLRLPLQKIYDFRNLVNSIETRSVPHVQDVSKCQNRDDYIQHYFFRVFSDSVMLCLCRPAVLSCDDEYDKDLADLYLSRCRSVLRTYLELLRLKCPIRRSWFFVHVTLSCALSLGLAANTFSIIPDKVFLKQFLDTLSQNTVCAYVPAYESALERLQGLLDGCEATSTAQEN